MHAITNSARQSDARSAPLVARGFARGRADGGPDVWNPVAVGPADFGRAGCVGRGPGWDRGEYRRQGRIPDASGRLLLLPYRTRRPAAGGGPGLGDPIRDLL